MCPLHGSAAGQPHCPRPRPRAAVTAAVATAAAPSTAAAPDDDRAAILDALRQLRKGTRARGTAARAQRSRRRESRPAPKSVCTEGRGGPARPLRTQRRPRGAGSRVKRGIWAPPETPRSRALLGREQRPA